MGRWRSHSLGKDRWRLWKTKWKHNWKVVKDRQRPIKTHKDWLADGRWDRNKFYSSDLERPLAKTKEKTLSDPERPSVIVKDWQRQRSTATHKDHQKDPQRLYGNQASSRGYTCSFLLALATRRPQSFSATEVEGDCKCSQASSISAIRCKKFNTMNILQHCPSDFVAVPIPGYTCNNLVSRSLQHQNEVLCCQCD